MGSVSNGDSNFAAQDGLRAMPFTLSSLLALARLNDRRKEVEVALKLFLEAVPLGHALHDLRMVRLRQGGEPLLGPCDKL